MAINRAEQSWPSEEVTEIPCVEMYVYEYDDSAEPSPTDHLLQILTGSSNAECEEQWSLLCGDPSYSYGTYTPWQRNL